MAFARVARTSFLSYRRTAFALQRRRLSIETQIEHGGAQVNVIYRSGMLFDVSHEFDWHGKPTVWSLQKYFHTLRVHMLFHDGRFCDYVKLSKEAKTLMFMVCTSNEIQTNFYDMVKHNPTKAVIVNLFMSSLGKTSIGFRKELRTLECDELLSAVDTKVVIVNEETRQPRPHPEWYVEKFGPLVKGPAPAAVKRLGSKPQVGVFRYVVDVLPSDVDNQNHMSYLTYLKFCSDCAHFAAESGALGKYRGDFAKYRVKNVSSLYEAEATLHDKLDVDVWEDMHQSDTLNFVISRKGSDIFHCSMQIHS